MNLKRKQVTVVLDATPNIRPLDSFKFEHLSSNENKKLELITAQK